MRTTKDNKLTTTTMTDDRMTSMKRDSGRKVKAEKCIECGCTENRACKGIKSLQPVLPIIRSHHERWDGLGYPDGLRGDQIPLLARILQLADIYDALTTVRPYKAAFSGDEALSIMMEETGKGWRDPHLVRVFADLVPMFRAYSVPDLSRLSLNALASSVESYTKDPAMAHSKKLDPNPVRLAG